MKGRSLRYWLSHSTLWRKMRERQILREHRETAAICEQLIKDYAKAPLKEEFLPKKHLPEGKLLIWQYWAQGYNEVPSVVKQCLDSVDQYCKDEIIIRLSNDNIQEYLDLPDYILKQKEQRSIAFFSDLLRLLLLRVYGGLWLDATILMTNPIPEEWKSLEFFVYRRDPDEKNFKYWRNTYAYYFGWCKGFRVNMLSSIMFAKPRGKTVSDLCDLLLFWWKTHPDQPNYFFLQILYDVYQTQDCFPLISDCIPHYLQKSIDDPHFSIMTREEIVRNYPFHKLTYKKE